MGWKQKKLKKPSFKAAEPKKNLVGSALRGQPNAPNITKEPARAAYSAGKSISQYAKDTRGKLNDDNAKLKSGWNTFRGNDPKRNKGPGPAGAPEVVPPDDPYNAGGAKNGEFNPYPFDWAKRRETLGVDGKLKDEYKLDVMKEREESPWLKQKLQNQRDEESFGRDDAAKNAEMGRSNAQSGLAQTSGASSGAMERMQTSSSKDALLAQQRVAQQGVANRGDLRINDTERQIGADRENNASALNQVDQSYGADRDLWKNKSSAYGGEQMAQQIEGQKSGDHWQKAMDWRDGNKGLGTIGKMNPFKADTWNRMGQKLGGK